MEIRTDAIGKRFLHGWVIRNFSHTFLENKVYGISGRNGTGKSTLLRLLSGLLSTSTGSITYIQDSHEITRDFIFKYINVAAPYGELVDEYTLSEMIHFHLQFKEFTNKLTPQACIDKMQLSHASNRILTQFSSGMKQRVKLGLALQSEGKILILDEPTSNLDNSAKDWFFNLLDDHRKDKIVLIASNEVTDFKFCDEIISLESQK